MPASRESFLSPRMEFPILLLNPPLGVRSFYFLAVVLLIGRHKFDSFMANPLVLPINNFYNPQPGLSLVVNGLRG